MSEHYVCLQLKYFARKRRLLRELLVARETLGTISAFLPFRTAGLGLGNGIELASSIDGCAGEGARGRRRADMDVRMREVALMG